MSILFFASRHGERSIGYFLSAKSPLKFFSNCRLLLMILITMPLALFVSPQSSTAQSIKPANDGTNTIVNPSGDRFNITGGQFSQDQQNLFHSFSRFGLDSNQIANFLSNPNIRNILGRITGGEPSIINGLVQVIGGVSNLYLMNPSGIVFGPNASLNVPGSFTATSANAIGFGSSWFNASGSNNYSVLTGNPSKFAFTMSNPGAIVNAGSLAVGFGQNLSLVGGTVINTGALDAPGGQITLAAVPGNNWVRLSQPGNPLSLEFQTPSPVGNQPQPWTGGIATLPLLLTGGNIPSATGLSVKNGQVVLTGAETVVPNEPGISIASGKLNVSSPDVGGSVQVLGNKVGLIGANIDASGTNGGGNVLIGGDYQGKGSVPNASRTYVSQDSTINANALQSGNGGRVIVWSDNTTRFDGTINARGGLTFGNGGFVEVSGKQNLIYRGTVNLSAPRGNTGSLLLDPTDITISNIPLGTGDIALPDILAASDFVGAPITISQSALQALPNTANVILEATNDITIGTLTGNILGFAASGGTPATSGSITFIANSDGIGGGSFSMNPTDIIQARGRNISISGNSLTLGGILTQSLNNTSNGGDITLTATNGNVISASGQIVSDFNNGLGALGNGGNITINANNGSVTADYISANSLASVGSAGNAGNINITASNGISVANGIQAFSNTIYFLSNAGNGGTITLTTGNGNIDASAIKAYSTTGSGNSANGGGVILNATNGGINVAADMLNVSIDTKSSASGNAGNGGLIQITAANGINIAGVLNASTSGTGVLGNAGAVTLKAGSGITTSVINSTSSSGNPGNGVAGNGGQISLSTTNGNINTGTLFSGSALITPATGSSKDGGNINLTANNGSITTDLIDSRSSGSGNLGNGGGITLNAGSGITTNNIDSSSFVNFGTGVAGNGGQISLSTTNGNITTGFLASYSQIATTATGTSKVGGAISVNAPNGNISTNSILPYSRVGSTPSGQGGNITLNSGNNITVTQSPPAMAVIDALGTVGGNVSITGNEINFAAGNVNFLIVRSNGSLILKPFTASQNIAIGGTADTGVGTLDITASDLAALSPGFSSVTFGGNTYSGNISTNSGTTTFNNPITLATTGTVLGGNIVNNGYAVNVLGRDISLGNIDTSGLFANGILNGGNVTLQSTGNNVQFGWINTQTDFGKGGNVNISATGNGLIRGTNTFLAKNGQNATISTIGVTGNGTVNIDPGANQTFTIGFDPSVPLAQRNGTAGTITTGAESLPLGTTIFGTYASPGGSIGVLAGGTPPTPIPPTPVPTPIPPTPVPTPIPPTPVPTPIPPTPTPTPPRTISAIDAAVSQVQRQPSSKLAFTPSRDRDVVESASDSLKRIEKSTGKKPAIIYASFLTDTGIASTDPTLPSNDDALTAEYLQKLQIPQKNSYIPISQFANKLAQQQIKQGKQPIQGSDQISLILVTSSGKPIRKTVNVTRKKVLDAAEDLLAQVEVAPQLDRSKEAYLKPSQQLYQWLVAPMTEELEKQKIDTILFSMDEELRGLPIAALHDGKKFIIETYSVGITPSFKLTDTRYQNIKNSQVLAMGATEFTNNTPLPSVPFELDIIRNSWPGAVFLNQEFTLANLKAQRERTPYGIIHLATHADFVSGDDAFIQLYGSERLNTNQLRSLGWGTPPVELLILSACKTARGDADAELGFAGIALQANVKSVIASLWKVSDEGTLVLMNELYRQLNRSEVTIKAEALRQAQLAMLKGQIRLQGGKLLGARGGNVTLPANLVTKLQQEDLSHPFYWAAFTMVGSPW